MRGIFVIALLLGAWCAEAAPAPAATRIVTLAPHLAELVCAAGGCEKLVGVSRYTDYPARAAALPQVGDAATVNLEQVLALQPDLVLAWDGGTPPDNIARLRALGLRVETVRVRSLKEIADALWQIGGWMNTRVAAGISVNLYYGHLDKLRRRYWQALPLRVMYQIEHNPIFTVSSLSPIDEAIRTCGGRNVFENLPRVAPVVSLEAVLAADPEVVVFAQQDNGVAIRELWARWPQATAQKNGNLYAVDADMLARQSPRLLDGIEQLCKVFDLVRAKRRVIEPATAPSATPESSAR